MHIGVWNGVACFHPFGVAHDDYPRDGDPGRPMIVGSAPADEDPSFTVGLGLLRAAAARYNLAPPPESLLKGRQAKFWARAFWPSHQDYDSRQNTWHALLDKTYGAACSHVPGAFWLVALGLHNIPYVDSVAAALRECAWLRPLEYLVVLSSARVNADTVSPPGVSDEAMFETLAGLPDPVLGCLPSSVYEAFSSWHFAKCASLLMERPAGQRSHRVARLAGTLPGRDVTSPFPDEHRRLAVLDAYRCSDRPGFTTMPCDAAVCRLIVEVARKCDMPCLASVRSPLRNPQFAAWLKTGALRRAHVDDQRLLRIAALLRSRQVEMARLHAASLLIYRPAVGLDINAEGADIASLVASDLLGPAERSTLLAALAATDDLKRLPLRSFPAMGATGSNSEAYRHPAPEPVWVDVEPEAIRSILRRRKKMLIVARWLRTWRVNLRLTALQDEMPRLVTRRLNVGAEEGADIETWMSWMVGDSPSVPPTAEKAGSGGPLGPDAADGPAEATEAPMQSGADSTEGAPPAFGVEGSDSKGDSCQAGTSEAS
ncbi:MAG: hypothetical protein HY905_03945 [Deltaproteobacteria bacterium]|nr:hypothetical protein [Deltaproteobacteria bacterium]